MSNSTRTISPPQWLSALIIVSAIAAATYYGQRAYAHLSSDDCRTVNEYDNEQRLVRSSTVCQ